MKRFVPVLALALLILGCASGNVTTSTNAVVPAATVQAQDNVYDVYLLVQQTHAAAVRQYEATKSVMDPALRQQTFLALNTMADGIDVSRAALQSWKRTSSSGVTPAYVLRGILDAAPSFLQLAVRVGIIDQKTADTITTLLGAIPAPVGARRPPGEKTWTALTDGRWYDGCNAWTNLGNGVWGSTALFCTNGGSL